jgi:energy-coupling factor transporter ATP-binding protein EcfA2
MTASLYVEETSGEDDAGRGTDLDSLGPGARRSVAIAAIDLYRDSALWKADALASQFDRGLTILLVEEPETGLHPALRRVLAKSLRQWATYGLQLVVVTHSPVFVNAADTA